MLDFTIKKRATQDIKQENTIIPIVSIRDLPYETLLFQSNNKEVNLQQGTLSSLTY